MVQKLLKNLIRRTRFAAVVALLALLAASAYATPFAVPRTDPSIQVNEGQSITLDGQASSDDSGFTIISWDWVQTGGPAVSPSLPLSGDLLSVTVPDVTSDTVLDFQLTVVNDDGETSSPVSVSITVVNVNQAPTAAAGSPQTVNEGALVTLTGAATDPDGDVLAISWTQISGPDVTLSNASIFAPTFTAPQVTPAGASLVFRLTVNDGHGGTDSSDVTITVNNSVNQPPVALDQSDTTPEDTSRVITLTVDDPGGPAPTFIIVSQPVHCVLSAINGPITGANVTYTTCPDYVGPDSFTFKATDGEFESNIATVFLNITPLPDAPVANAGPDMPNIPEFLPTLLDGRGSFDVDLDETASLTFAWSPATNLSATNIAQPTFTGPDVSSPQNFVYTLTVTDITGASSLPDSVTVTVTPVNNAPVANPQSPTTDEDTAKVITLTGLDQDGNSLTFTVVTQPAHGSVSNPAQVSPTSAAVTYTPSPNYNGDDSFTFRVNDGFLNSPAATVSIRVNAANDPPVANAGPDQDIIEGKAVGLVGSGTDVDVGQTVTTFQWSGANLDRLSNPNISNPVFTAPLDVNSEQFFTYTLTVTDNNILPASSTDTVTVRVTNGYPPVAEAGDNDFATELTSVTLLGSATDLDFQVPITFRWTQVAGPPVIISNPNIAQPAFIAPSVTGETPLTFLLTVTDNGGNTDTDQVIWTIFDVAQALPINPLLRDIAIYPSPFSTSGGATIRYDLRVPSDVTILIVDVFGKVVREFSSAFGTAGGVSGTNFIRWDGKNGEGNTVGNGAYIVQVKATDGSGNKAKALERVGVRN